MILLYDEPPIAVSPTLAVAWGINDAAFMQQVHFWCKVYECKRDVRHLHNGFWWVYNTNEAWREQLPWMCLRSVKTMVRRLTSAGVVLMDRWNLRAYDKTAWYTIDVDALYTRTAERLAELQARQDTSAYSLTFIQTTLPLLEAADPGAKVALSTVQNLHPPSCNSCTIDGAEIAPPIPETNHIWERVLQELHLCMTRGTYDRWLAGTTLQLTGHQATVTCRDGYAQEWLTHRLNQVIEPVLRIAACDPDLQITYCVSTPLPLGEPPRVLVAEGQGVREVP